MPEYTFSPSLDQASIDDYVALFSASFTGEGKLDAKYLEWQYIENPHGKVLGFDAFLGGELVAHYAIIPRRYHIGARHFEAALSLNTATHPKHQGKGLFVKLATATYDAAARRGVSFVIGAANANSIGGFVRKLGFSALGHIRLYPSFKAPDRVETALDLKVDAAWLAWRLANPSRSYTYVRHNDNSITIRTRIKGIPFNIARLDKLQSELMDVSNILDKEFCIMPGLSPIYASKTPPKLLHLPLRLQPSPWHVIWRSLDPAFDPSLARQLRFDGLSMDTF